MSGYMKLAPSPALAIDGEMKMTSKPENGLTTFRFNFNSVLFGAYDVLVAGMFNQPTTKMSFQLQVTSKGEMIKRLTASVKALAATFSKALTDFKKDVNGVKNQCKSKLNSGCKKIFGRVPTFSLGPLYSPKIKLAKTLKVNFKGKCLKRYCKWGICTPKICAPSYKNSWKISISISPIKLLGKYSAPSAVTLCQKGMGHILTAAFKTVDVLLNGMKKFADKAANMIVRALGSIGRMFSFKKFNFEVAFDIIKVSGKFVLDLEMTVGGKRFNLNIALAFNANIGKTIFNEIKKKFLSALPSFDDFNKAVDKLDDVPGEALNTLKTSGQDAANKAKKWIKDKFNVGNLVTYAKKKLSFNSIKRAFNKACKKIPPGWVRKIIGSGFINKICNTITGKV